jgi:hypothetical protein
VVLVFLVVIEVSSPFVDVALRLGGIWKEYRKKVLGKYYDRNEIPDLFFFIKTPLLVEHSAIYL